MSDRTLSGRKFLLTGASRGIGRALAERLIAEGAQLCLMVRDPASVSDLGSAVQVVQGDLRVSDDLEELVERAAQRLGGLDGFVQCAGVVVYEDLLRVSKLALAEQLQVNLVAPFVMASAAGRLLAERGSGGDLLFIASTLGLRPAPQTAAYAATKAALISLTRSCALELGAYGIRANAILPGVIDTQMIDEVRPGAVEGPQAQRAILAGLHPLRRLGSVLDVAEAACHLLRADFVSGSLLTVDGGISVGSPEHS